MWWTAYGGDESHLLTPPLMLRLFHSPNSASMKKKARAKLQPLGYCSRNRIRRARSHDPITKRNTVPDVIRGGLTLRRWHPPSTVVQSVCGFESRKRFASSMTETNVAATITATPGTGGRSVALFFAAAA